MKSKIKEYLLIVFPFIIVGLIGLGFGIKIANIMAEHDGKVTTEHIVETTNAKPIYQQQIGDDTEPDILIIYEAEVDGVKVYPSVIKEAK